MRKVEDIKKGKDFGLNLNQSKFCEIYANSEEFFANGTRSYIEAYSTKSKKLNYLTAQANACKLLRITKILEYINELLELRGLNDPFVDKQLELLITQNADFKSKLGAIKEYNNLKTRITKSVDVTSKGEKIDGFNFVKNATNNKTNG